MAFTIITPPATEPITLEEIKQQLKIDWIEEDVLLAGYIKAAREFCEQFQNKAYVTQTLEKTLDQIPYNRIIELNKPPLKNVVKVSYTDINGITTDVDSSNYFTDTKSIPGRIIFKKDFSISVKLQEINAISVIYTAGNTINEVPQKVKIAIMLLVGHWYKNREATGQNIKEIDFAVSALLSPDRMITL